MSEETKILSASSAARAKQINEAVEDTAYAEECIRQTLHCSLHCAKDVVHMLSLIDDFANALKKEIMLRSIDK